MAYMYAVFQMLEASQGTQCPTMKSRTTAYSGAIDDRGGEDFEFASTHEVVNMERLFSDLSLLCVEHNGNLGRETLALNAQRNQRHTPETFGGIRVDTGANRTSIISCKQYDANCDALGVLEESSRDEEDLCTE